MNAVTEFSGVPVESETPKRAFQVDETHWGYIVKSMEEADAPILLRQAISWFMGTSLMVAIVGLWAMPGAMFDGETLIIKLGLTAIFMAFAGLCFWLASRGMRTEVQFDLVRNEIRSVARNGKGAVTLLDRLTFEDVGSVFVSPSQHGTEQAKLVLRLGCSPHLLDVAHGREDALSVLRDRIGMDMLNPSIAAPRKSLQALQAVPGSARSRKHVAA
ncbi:hypothetical protein [Cognatishimia sp. MH4019]|uniref:hypothetical protein n=1 Tax=Cognatishimia sp. MH4019 TaxID=2854030 RepID=UPI001CD44364|nr:hypothetical protein [Cognatishimia sp. MH4019]